jgi:hypothetical protein
MELPSSRRAVGDTELLRDWFRYFRMAGDTPRTELLLPKMLWSKLVAIAFE